MHRVIAHCDLDCFFAAVEQRDRPEWQGKPVIVGSPPTARGVVATVSYEARRFGVHSAMASVTAERLCPSGIFVAPRLNVYRQVSSQVMDILTSAGAPIEQVGIDEAYLNFSSVVQSANADDSIRLAIPIAQH